MSDHLTERPGFQIDLPAGTSRDQCKATCPGTSGMTSRSRFPTVVRRMAESCKSILGHLPLAHSEIVARVVCG